MSERELVRLRERLLLHDGPRFICLATTANVNNPPLMVGSLRSYENTIAGNLILRDASLLKEIVDRFDDVASLFFVDCEVKGGVDLSEPALESIAPGMLHFFKPNDFTVEALDEWVAQRIPLKSGLRAAVIGAGNIGAKAALRLCERGFEVRLVGRKMARVSAIAQGLNAIARGRGTILASIDSVQACADVDLLLGCTPGSAAIDAVAVAVVGPHALLVDVGNGTFSIAAISKAHERSLILEVLSPSAGWEGFLRRYFSTQQLQSGLGRRQLEDGVWIVSRGVMGSPLDVLVDNVSVPSRVIGVCNGTGDLIYGRDAEQRMKYVEERLGID